MNSICKQERERGRERKKRKAGIQLAMQSSTSRACQVSFQVLALLSRTRMSCDLESANIAEVADLLLTKRTDVTNIEVK
jgi:hypothetical protein